MLRKIYWFFVSQVGLNPLLFLRSLRGLPWYVRDLRNFKAGFSGTLRLKPCLHDRYEEGGSTKSEYFWQDLLVARMIFQAAPIKHIDVGSRVDGFVAHVASFREIEVLDVRPISTTIPGIVFRTADLMALTSEQEESCDSLSCLHALEHFGLGRYGDPINPLGWHAGLANMARLLQKGGVLYLSVPIGQERVEFNANWVFEPSSILVAAKKSGLELVSLKVIARDVRDVEPTKESLDALAGLAYALGIFTFKKF